MALSTTLATKVGNAATGAPKAAAKATAAAVGVGFGGVQFAGFMVRVGVGVAASAEEMRSATVALITCGANGNKNQTRKIVNQQNYLLLFYFFLVFVCSVCLFCLFVCVCSVCLLVDLLFSPFVFYSCIVVLRLTCLDL